MLTPALQIQCPRAGNALHVLTLDGNDRTLGLPHNALPTSQTDRGYTTAPNSNQPGSSCGAAPSSIALTQPRTLIGNKDSLTGIIPRPPSKVANIPSAKTTNRQRSLRESTRTHSTNKSTKMTVSRQTRSNRIIQSAKPSTVAIKPFPSEVVPSVSPQSNFNPTSKIHRQVISGGLMVSPSQMSHEMPQVLSSRDTPLVISTNEYKSAPRSLEKDRPLSSRHRNSYPLGAHTAGFYSKHRSSTIHSGINVPTVNAMLRDMDLLSQSRVQQRDQSSPQSSSHPTRTDTVVGNMAADTCFIGGVYTGLGLSMRRESHSARCKRVNVSQPVQNDALLGAGIGASHTLPAVDMKNIGFHITRLTDIDSSHGKLACPLLRLFACVKSLPAADQSSKAYLEMKIRTEKNTEIFLEIISCISLDLSLDDAVEQLVNDASRLVDCELVLFILSTAKQTSWLLTKPTL
ncbi:hypothetical protein BASA83_013241 [Batrachochytrium salamandrivorans]|nr:hypothetical protein BASA83_013241 [Batrachochytrium salamandrivorans]